MTFLLPPPHDDEPAPPEIVALAIGLCVLGAILYALSRFT